MLDIVITSHIKHKADVYQYVWDICKDLKINRLNRSITIAFKRNLEEDAWGWAVGDTDECDIEINRSIPWQYQMVTLAHELVHAKQYFRKELTAGFAWKGKDWSKCVYEWQPWERQAHMLELKLWKKHWHKIDEKSLKKVLTSVV